MAASDIAKITARISWILGSHDGTFSATLADDRFVLEEIRRAAIETESEIVRTICESYHPARYQFLAWSADLANGDTLPAHIGQVEAVRIKPHSAASGYDVAESTSRENIRMWRENNANVFDTIAHNASGSLLAGYFNITGETVTFTGHAAQAKLCTYTPDYATPALQLEDRFDSLIVAGAIPRLNKLGVPQDLVATYGSLYQAGMLNLRQGLQTRPDVSLAQKVG